MVSKYLALTLFLFLFSITIKADDNLEIKENQKKEPTTEEPDEEETKEEESPHVHKLTDANFESAFNVTSNWLIEFYTPWCGHCQELLPKFAKAAEENQDIRVKYGKVDATKETNLAKTYKIKSYPTILWMTKKDGIIQSTIYKGEREPIFFNNYIKEEMTPEVDIKTLEELWERKPQKSKVILIVCDKTEQHYDKTYRLIKKVSLALEKETVIQTNSQEIRNYYGINDVNENFIVGFNHFEKGGVFFTFGKKEIKPEQYIREAFKEKANTLDEGTVSKVHEILDGVIKSAFLVYDKNSTFVTELITNARNALNRHKGQFYSLHVDNRADYVKNILDALSIKDEDYPVFIILNPPEHMGKKDDYFKYKLVGNGNVLSEEKIASFIDDFNNNKLESVLSTDPVPELRIENGVERVVGSTIREFANTPGKDSLICICTELSVTCRQLTKILERVASKIDNSTLVIGQIDYNSNEFQHLDFEVFPTIAMFRDNAENSEKYNKASLVYFSEKFTTKNIIDFVEQKAFHKPRIIDPSNNPRLNITEINQIREVEVKNNEAEDKWNLIRYSTEDEGDYKTDSEANQHEVEENRKKEEQERQQKEEEEKKNREKKEQEDEEPDLQDNETESVGKTKSQTGNNKKSDL